jgi:hypothetical protein
MRIEGITWHAVTLKSDQFTAMKNLCRQTFGLTPMIEKDGWALYPMPNGTMLDLFEQDSAMIPTYGLNEGVVFGFRIDDIETASAEIKAAGLEVLCDIHRIPEMKYAFCHFRGPDGRVYGINEKK